MTSKQKMKQVYVLRVEDTKIIQRCAYSVVTQKVSVQCSHEKRRPYTLSKMYKTLPTQYTIKKISTCAVLRNHAKDLKDDPERLSTKFLKNMIGVKK